MAGGRQGKNGLCRLKIANGNDRKAAGARKRVPAAFIRAKTAERHVFRILKKISKRESSAKVLIFPRREKRKKRCKNREFPQSDAKRVEIAGLHPGFAGGCCNLFVILKVYNCEMKCRNTRKYGRKIVH